MDDADEREEGGEDLVDIMHVDGEESPRMKTSPPMKMTSHPMTTEWRIL